MNLNNFLCMLLMQRAGVWEAASFKDKALLWNTAETIFVFAYNGDNRMIIGGRETKYLIPKKRDELLQ
jgi:hypothetical protein